MLIILRQFSVYTHLYFDNVTINGRGLQNLIYYNLQNLFILVFAASLPYLMKEINNIKDKARLKICFLFFLLLEAEYFLDCFIYYFGYKYFLLIGGNEIVIFGANSKIEYRIVLVLVILSIIYLVQNVNKNEQSI